jgi:cyclase
MSRFLPRHIVFFTYLVLFSQMFASADSTKSKERTITKLAEDVYEIRHPDAPDGFPQGNTTVVIGEKAVLVVDTCLLPSCARMDIEQIRKWTSKPVGYVVNTHWHSDHNMGNGTYAAAFPGLQIIAHKHTAKMIREFVPGAMERYPARASEAKKAMQEGKKFDGSPMSDADRREAQKAVDGVGAVVAEIKDAAHAPPNVIFDHALDVDLGNRMVEIRFLGLANTAGDTVVYLPGEKIIAVGDILDHPVPYLFGGFPVEAVGTLQRLSEIDAQMIVPGHGEVLHDKTYITLVIDLVKAVNTEAERELNQGKTPEEVIANLPKNFDVETWRRKFAGNDRGDAGFFNASFDGLVRASVNEIKMR